MAGPGAEEACSELVRCWAEYEEREDKTWSLVITCWAGSGGLFTLGKTSIIKLRAQVKSKMYIQ